MDAASGPVRCGDSVPYFLSPLALSGGGSCSNGEKTEVYPNSSDGVGGRAEGGRKKGGKEEVGC